MTAQMHPRERVQKALAFQEPDRIPTAISGGPSGIVDEVYFKLLPDDTVKFNNGHRNKGGYGNSATPNYGFHGRY